MLDRLVAGDPAALPGRRRPGPQRPVPLVRPAAGPEAERDGRPRGRARRAVLPGRRARTRPTTTRRIDALAAIPEPIVRFLAASGSSSGVPEREPMLEVLTRRYYREHELHDLRTLTRRPAAVRRVRLQRWTTGRPTWSRPWAPSTELADPAGAGRSGRERDRAGRGRAGGSRVGRRPLPVLARGAAVAGRGLGAAAPSCWPRSPFAQRVRRVTVAVCPGGGRPVSYFTFRPGPDGVVEDDLVRGLHPLVGRRLNLWRLRNFRITRLDAPEDVLLYHCVAQDNQTDERLVALAQVRELTACATRTARSSRCRTPSGPLTSCLEAIRRARTRAALDGAQLDMNHVVAAHLAVGRRPAERARVAAAHHRAADGGRRHRGGPRCRAASPARTAAARRSPCASPTSPGRGSSPR